ncbi:MAG: protein serine/threonine phosphatase [Bacteroidetes bacterium]|nr:protein serine/threonine phosphatase [Bacteroidota bacterium]
MKYFYIVFLFLFLYCKSYSQYDSLGTDNLINKFISTNSSVTFSRISDSLYSVSKSYQKRFLIRTNKLAIQKQNKFFEGMSLNSLALWYADVHLYSDAYTTYNQALKIFEATNSDAGKFNVLSNLGALYYYLNQPKKALVYEFRAYEIFKNKMPARYSKGASVCLNIGSMYGQLNNLPMARTYFLRALEYHLKSPEDSITKAFIYNNISDTYLYSGDIMNAEKYSLIAFDIKMKYGNKKEKANAYLNIAEIAQKKGEYTKAARLFSKGKEFCSEDSPDENLHQIYSGLSEVYESMHDLKQELKYVKLTQRIRVYLDSIGRTSEISSNELIHKYRQQSVNDSIQNKTQIVIRDIKLEQKKRESVYGIIALIIISFIAFLIFNRYRLTQKQKVIIEEQKHLVEEKNKEITDSINYARNLQDALIPNPEELKTLFTESFVIYLPKDIVAGDFYWWHHFPSSGKTLIAVADCTGHGVPGAMVSVVCINALNRAVNEFKLSEPNEILDKVNLFVNETFSKNNKQVHDGMDISLLLIDRALNQIRWSGANNKLIYFENGLVYGIKPDKQPIGKNENHTPFTLHTLPLIPGSVFYLLTDGYSDQFGGAKNKKMGFATFKKLMEKNYFLPLDQQKINFESVFREWKKNGEQTDDVSLIGIKI